MGCGAGNTALPLLAHNENNSLKLLAYDYADHAIKTVRADPLYSSPRCGSIHAELWDLTSLNGPPPGIQPGSVDYVILVFVMSALHPEEWSIALSNIHTVCKPVLSKMV